MTKHSLAFQDYYPADVAHCYGCGRLNEAGHQLKSRWEGEESVARYTPRQYHTAIPGYVYGGLIASLIDCHGTGSASAAAARLEGWDPSAQPVPQGELPRFVTASLHVDYVRPTPLGPELEVRGKVLEATERKVVVEATLSAEGEVTALGKVIAVRMPEHMVY
jgi:acyl-coenzyme A thioesterase PaaI-like protein